jgi:outer membrane protein assembly factor BamA
VFSEPADGHIVPFYMLPSLGGQNTLRGYHDYRFHDRDLVAVSVESRWALTAHVDGAVFIDAGTVAPRLGDLDLSALKTSYGVGLRLHTRTTTLGRVDVGISSEGWRVMFKMNDPLALTRSAHRTIVAPFVP